MLPPICDTFVWLCRSAEDARRRAVVEVILPENEAVSGGAASASSAAPTEASLIAQAIAKLPPDLAAMAEDKKRKAKSSDPGWKYGFWPDIGKKEFIQCIFCKKVVPSGIKRFKQHLAGGYSDAVKCGEAPELVRREMNGYLVTRSRTQVQVPATLGWRQKQKKKQIKVEVVLLLLLKMNQMLGQSQSKFQVLGQNQSKRKR